jgi:hypothetical protein
MHHLQRSVKKVDVERRRARWRAVLEVEQMGNDDGGGGQDENVDVET